MIWLNALRRALLERAAQSGRRAAEDAAAPSLRQALQGSPMRMPSGGPRLGEALDVTPGNDYVFRAGPTRIKYDVLPNGDLELASLDTPMWSRNKGHARRAMHEFLTRPELRGRRVSLVAWGEDQKVDQARLVRFYESLGFKALPGDTEAVDMALRVPRVAPSAARASSRGFETVRGVTDTPNDSTSGAGMLLFGGLGGGATLREILAQQYGVQ